MSDHACQFAAARDAEAGALCRLLIDEMKMAPNAIDAGVPFVACETTTPGTCDDGWNCSVQVESHTAGDKTLQPGEIYTSALALLEEEEDRFVASQGKTSRPFTDLVSTRTTFRHPGLFSDFDPKTHDDDKLLQRIGRTFARMRADLVAQGYAKDTPDFRIVLAQRICDWMFDPKGLGVSKIDLAGRERAVIELMRLPPGERQGDCSELARLLCGLMRLAGLDAEILDVQWDKLDVTIFWHMAVALFPDPNDRSRMITIDPYHKGWMSEQGHFAQSIMPAVSALAAFNANAEHAAVEPSALFSSTEPPLAHALRYDPHYALALYMRALRAHEHGDTTQARTAIEAARRARPCTPNVKSLEREIITP